MSTNHSSLLAYISNRVDQYQNKYALQRGPAFMLWYGVEALGLDEDEAFAATAMDGGNDNGIDLFYIDDESQAIVIAQGKFQSNGTYTARPGVLYELLHSTDKLQNPETLKQDGRTDLADIALDFNAAMGKGYSIDYHFVYMGPTKKEVTDAQGHFNADPENPERFARVVDLDLLQQIHDEYIDASTRIAEAIVTIDPRTAFEQTGSYGRSLVGTVSGTELKRLHDEHRDALFDRNVRLFLGTRKGSVNAGIRDTLSSADERGNFWAYNNGVTFICDSFDFDKTTGQLTIRKFSIVNGCQTTVSIASSSDKAPTAVDVLARFIAQPDTRVVDQIIKYNNSQNKIRDWDLSSQDKNQKRLKNRLAEGPHPFFYQLRKGEWAHLTADEKQKFTRGNKPQIIVPDLLAQRLAAFKGNPVTAYKDKSSLFSTHARTVFPQDLSVEEVLLAWHAGEAAEEAVAKAVVKAQRGNNRQLVRILTRGGKIFTLAVMAVILEERNGPAYVTRIRPDRAGSNGTRRDLDNYATVALTYYLDVMEDRIESGNDVNQMVRSEESFSSVQRRVRSKWERESLSAQFVDALPKLV